METTKELKCKDKVKSAFESRREAIRRMLDPSRGDVAIATDDEIVIDGEGIGIVIDRDQYDADDLVSDVWNDWEDEIREAGRERFNEYGLAFDYVEAGTFSDQREPFFRYQISYGGPSEEFRFYLGAGATQPHRIEFWHLDWFDGACVDCSDDDVAEMLWNDLTLDGDADQIEWHIERAK